MAFVQKILCVDDDEDDLFFIREVIRSQSQPFEIESASNGWEALNYLENCRKKDLYPCLVIMDMNMPRMDGRETIKKIREDQELVKIPVVVFTTSSNPNDKNFFESQGIHFITKPFDYKIFANEIVELLAFCADLKD